MYVLIRFYYNSLNLNFLIIVLMSFLSLFVRFVAQESVTFCFSSDLMNNFSLDTEHYENILGETEVSDIHAWKRHGSSCKDRVRL